MRTNWIIIVGALCLAYPAMAQSPPSDSDKVKQLEERVDELETEMLRMQTALPQEDDEDAPLKHKRFTSMTRSLQAANPELSFSGDIFATWLRSPGGKEYLAEERSGMSFRALGIHLQSNLDPFSLTKVAFELTDEGVGLEEAYATWTAILPGVSLSAGRFRQQLGVVNRWHEDGLDQANYPLMLETPFGEGGLAQTGLSMHVRMPPLWTHSLEMIIEVTNGSNENVFSGQFFSVPAGLVRLVNYWDLSRNTYLQLGLTGMGGFNFRRGIQPSAEDAAPPPDPAMSDALKHANTVIGGADLTLSWEPLNQAKYHHFTWRTEALFIRKDLYTWSPELELFLDEDPITWWGGYSSLEYKLTQQWITGIRGDLVQAFQTNNDDLWAWQAVPYLTWWQSEFVRARLEYNYHQPHLGDPIHRVMLQVTFAAGPHKHERY